MPAVASKFLTTEKTSTFLLPFCDCSFVSGFAGTSGASGPALTVAGGFGAKAFSLLFFEELCFAVLEVRTDYSRICFLCFSKTSTKVD